MLSNPPPPQNAYNIEQVFDFLGQKLKFWQIINVDLDIKVPKINFSLKTRLSTISTFPPESQFFSQNAPIISSIFSNF